MTAQIINLQVERERRSELEVCVSCGKPTKIRKDEPIDLRSSYVQGAGQLCGPCYRLNIIKTKQFVEALDKERYRE